MSERSDLRQITQSIGDALAGYEPDAMLAMLTHLFREYVVDGPPPMLVHQHERIEDLEGLSFGQLITALQTRLDVPELSLFQVDGEQVSVRVGGVLTPLAPPRPRGDLGAPPRVTVEETALPANPGAPASARPSVEEAVARGRGDLAGVGRDAPREGAPGVRASAAPAPRRGVSIRGRSGGGAAPVAESAQPETASARPEAAPARQAPPPEPPADEDIASTRFSLLELD